MTNGYAVAAHDLVKNYPGGVRALNCLSITVRRGEVFGLLGPNGSPPGSRPHCRSWACSDRTTRSRYWPGGPRH